MDQGDRFVGPVIGSWTAVPVPLVHFCLIKRLIRDFVHKIMLVAVTYITRLLSAF